MREDGIIIVSLLAERRGGVAAGHQTSAAGKKHGRPTGVLTRTLARRHTHRRDRSRSESVKCSHDNTLLHCSK